MEKIIGGAEKFVVINGKPCCRSCGEPYIRLHDGDIIHACSELNKSR